MTRNIDELNNLNTRAEEPEEYFAKMDLPKKEKQRRVEFTKKANEIFDLILVMLLLSDYRDFELYESLRKRLEGYLLALIAEFTTPDDYLIDYASGAADNFIEATKKNESNEWFFSADRALYNAENSANDVLNYDLYMQAIADGKTHKRWITEKDNRVRLSHKLLDGKTIEIRKLFYPGGVPMRFPKDYEYAEAFPRELINCRCSIKYLPEDKEEEKKSDNYNEISYSDPIVNRTFQNPKEITESKQNRVDSNYNNSIIKEKSYQINTGGKRNDEPLTEKEVEEAIRLIREQGYEGDIEYTIHSNTKISYSVEGGFFHHFVLGTDFYPSRKGFTSANSRVSGRGTAAHEVVGHYLAWLKGKSQEIEDLEEAQASFRASKFGINLTKKERFDLWQDGLDRLKNAGYTFDEIKDSLYIWEK